MEIEERKKIAIEAVRRIGKLLRENFGKFLNIEGKGDRTLVTNIDLEAEKIIVQRIRKTYPQDDILSEENIYHIPNSDYKWIIDPLDGTHNYIHQIEIFGVSVALAFRGEVVLGIIYIPLSEELYIAQRGKGAYLNGKRIRVSQRKVKEATLIFDSSIRQQKEPMLNCLKEVADNVFNIRMFGSTARSLSYIAEGKADLEIEYNDKVWDFAAGLLLVEEAGGKATTLGGGRWSLNTEGYIASNGLIHNSVLKMINNVR